MEHRFFSALPAVLISCAVALAASPTQAPAAEDSFPNKLVRIIVPFPPGGSSDPVARLVAQRMSEAFRQRVIVENMPGASTMIATEHVARSAPDGYTMLLASGSLTVNPSLYRKVNYDPVKDFSGVSLASWFPMILHVHPSVPARSVAELVALAKASPGKLTYASGGVAAANHLAGEMFKSLAGVYMLHIPYKGGAPALTDAVGGQVDVMFGSILQSLPHVRSGRLRGLAVTGTQRSPLAPELPTVAESGVAGYDVTSWNGFVVPSGTPRAAVARLNSEITRILRLPELREALAVQGATALPTTPEETRKFLANEVSRWKQLIEKAGIKAD